MSSKVGTKGQVVISKDIRQRLGVQPGWIAIQRLAGDHVEVYFIPPAHRKSLKGSLARFTRVRVGVGSEWDNARDEAWKAMAEERFGKEDNAS